MARRFHAGYHAGFNQWGVWLSRPGIDVLSAGPASDFLLRPDYKVEQIVMSGNVEVDSGLSTTVIYPSSLPQYPYVQFQANISSNREYPHSLDAVGGTGADAREVVLTLAIQRGVLYFTNNSANNLFVDFIIYGRSIGA